MVALTALPQPTEWSSCPVNRIEKNIFFAGISGLVVEYNVAIVVTRVRFPADANFL